jgi:hypothetical protein
MNERKLALAFKYIFFPIVIANEEKKPTNSIPTSVL